METALRRRFFVPARGRAACIALNAVAMRVWWRPERYGKAQSLLKILVIHTNLNCYAEFPPPLQGAQRPQWAGTHAKCVRILRGVRGRVGVGVNDIAHELKLCFFNYLPPSPQPYLAARAVPVPQGEGAYWLFSRLSVPRTSIRKNAIPQYFEQVLSGSVLA